MIVEAQHDDADPDVEAALGDLVPLLDAHQPGSRATAHLLSATSAHMQR